MTIREHGTTDPSEPLGTSTAPGVDRRKAIGMGAIAAGAAWVAPAILSMDAAAAQTGPPPPPPDSGVFFGTAVDCAHDPYPFIEMSLTGPLPGGTTRLTTTAANGTFSFVNLPEGPYLLAGPAGSPLGTMTLYSQDGSSTTFTLQPNCRNYLRGFTVDCRGTVSPYIEVSATGPLPGGTVHLATSNANGEFYFADLTPGDYDVTRTDTGSPQRITVYNYNNYIQLAPRC